jgi:hypothetical protein
MSYFLLILAFPFFVAWTVYGTYIFTKVSTGDNSCTKKIESYSFLIFWFILCYTLIISYTCILGYAYAESRKTNQMRKSMI